MMLPIRIVLWYQVHGINIGIITDIGYACKQVIKYFSQCQAAFLESNYCADMLANGSYPYHLQKRISGDEGHLSNAQALGFIFKLQIAGLKLLILSHLSKNNNKPELVETLFNQQAGEYTDCSGFPVCGHTGFLYRRQSTASVVPEWKTPGEYRIKDNYLFFDG